MKPSTAWSLLAFAMALASYALHRDISANVFLGCVFIIHGLNRPASYGFKYFQNFSETTERIDGNLIHIAC